MNIMLTGLKSKSCQFKPEKIKKYCADALKFEHQ